MDDLKFYGDVRFQTNVGLEQYEPGDWVLAIEGTIIGSLELKDEPVAEEVQIGQLSLQSLVSRYVPYRIYDVCDSHSEYMFQVYQALFDEAEDETKSELDIEESWDGLLYIEAIDMVERFQHTDVVVQAVETAIRCFCRGGIITAHRDALDLTVEQWRKLGFRRIPGFEIVVRDNTRSNPYETTGPDDD